MWRSSEGTCCRSSLHIRLQLDFVRTKEARKTEEGNKKIVDKGEHVGMKAKTTSYKKSKELERATGDSSKVGELHDEATVTHASDMVGKELTIIKRQATSVVYVRSKNMCSVI
ncbi:hypothetical protein Sjap_006279 [Stephania japonica]|uniref:Uncharacterized protein n=1 Tax=Stephania japonica TaxID=461633 RepID=A0AAP0K5Q7_9MAGN